MINKFKGKRLFYRKTRNFKGIYFKNFVKIFVLLLSVIFIFISWYFLQTKETIKEINFNNADTISNSVIEIVHRNISNGKRSMANLVIDNDVKKFFSISSLENETLLENRIVGKIFSCRNLTNGIMSMYVYSKTNNHVISETGMLHTSSYSDNEWFRNLDIKNKEIKVIPRTSDFGEMISIATAVKSSNIDGIIIVNINLNMIISEIKEHHTNVKIDLIDNGTVIFSTDKENFMKEYKNEEIPYKTIITEDDKVYFKCVHIDSYTGENYIIKILMEEYNLALQELIQNTFLLFFMLIILCAIVSATFSVYMSNPFLKISNILNSSSNIKITDLEMDDIINKILYIIDTNKDLQKKIDTHLTEYTKLQLYALQVQINPHYLNNTLSVISMNSVLKYGVDNTISQDINNIARMLTYSFDTKNIYITLEKEREFLEYYIQILKKSYPKIEVSLELDEKISQCRILRVCIQPLIENSVFHGSFGGKKGEIDIKIKDKGEKICITVKDDGKGISSEKLEELKNSLQESDVFGESVGLKNVYNRLKLIYNKNLMFDINSEVGCGTEIQIEIPKI